MKALRVIMAVVAMAAAFPGLSLALPTGRAWAVAEPTTYPRLSPGFAGARLDTDPAGGIRLLVGAQWDTTFSREWATFEWRGSGWNALSFSGLPATSHPEPALARYSTSSLIWISGSYDVSGYVRMVWSDFDATFSSPDTILTTPLQDTEYGACAVGATRWVVRSDIVIPPGQNRIRIAYSNHGGPWHELPDREGIDEAMCAIGPVSESQAMVAFAGRSGLAWVLLEDNRVVRRGILDPRPGNSLHPRFRVRPQGGLWLLWSDYTWIHVSSYHDGEWHRGDSLQAVHPPGQTFIPSWTDLSRDQAERPVLAWGDLGYAYTYRDVGCAAFPTATGWSAGEEIPGSENIFTTPTVAVDGNGDAWFAWQLLRRSGLIFTHTYTRATVAKLTVDHHGPKRTLTWVLDEPAPGSWWTVFRARKNEPFEEAGRAQAGEGLELSWIDDDSHPEHTRYKIRRDCLDVRYRVESEEATWPPGPARRHAEPGGPRLRQPATPLGQEAELELASKPGGAMQVALYDLQGRMIYSRTVEASEAGRLRFSLGSAGTPLSSGVYFARVRDASGVWSPAVRAVVLK